MTEIKRPKVPKKKMEKYIIPTHTHKHRVQFRFMKEPVRGAI